MKALAIALTLLLSTTATADETRTYDVTAKSYRGTYNQSCGAGKRMLKDKHRVSYDGRNVLVNRMPWKLESGSIPGDAVITFHKESQHKTSLEMDVYANDSSLFGTYTLLGVTVKGDLCSDVVEIRGVRI